MLLFSLAVLALSLIAILLIAFIVLLSSDYLVVFGRKIRIVDAVYWALVGILISVFGLVSSMIYAALEEMLK